MTRPDNGPHYVGWRGRVVQAVALVGIVLVATCGVAHAAAPPTWTYSCATEPNPGTCERLTFVASELSTIDDATTSNGTRADLAWVGVWLLAGMTVGAVVGRWFAAEMRGWGGGI